MPTKDLTFRLFGEDSTATLALTRLSKQAETTGKHFEGAFKAAKFAVAGVGLAAGAAVAAIVKTGIGEAMDASAGMVQLQAGIKSTGNAANVTVAGMEALASSIQDYSGQTDDSIVKTEQLLLTFTNIKNRGPNKIFDETTKAAADMAARMGGDASSKAVLLGKALNDPVAGLSKLTKVGVTFTEAQKSQVAAMEKAGDVAGAQKVILAELNKEFGGSAKAAGQALPGQLARVQRAFEDVSQTVMETILPVVTPAIGKITTAVKASLPQMQRMAKIVATDLGHAFKSLAPVVGQLGTILVTKVVPAVAKFADWMGRNKTLVVTIAGVIGGLVIAYKAYIAIMAVVKLATAAWAAGQAILNIALNANPIGLVIIAVGALIAAVVLLVTHWKEVCAFLQDVWGAVCKWFADTMATLGAVFSTAWAGIAATFKGVWTNITGFFSDAGTWLLDAGKNIIDGLVGGIKGAIGAVTGVIGDIANSVIGPFKQFLGIASPSKVFHKFGSWIGEGLNKGLTGSLDQITATSGKMADAVKSAFKSGSISKSAETNALADITAMTKKLKVVAAERAKAMETLNGLKSDRANMVGETRSSTIGGGDITTFAAPGDAIQGLTAMVANTKRFTADLKTLAAKGIGGTMLNQLVAGWNSNPTGALTTADQLIANPNDLKQIIALQGRLSTAAGALGTTAGNLEYGNRIDAASGRVKVLDWREQKIAQTGLKKAAGDANLHIHLSGHYAGTKDELAKTIKQVIGDAVRKGVIPKNWATA